MKKVLYLTNIPSPYRVDFWNEMGKYCDLTVWFEANNEKNREWSIENLGVHFKYRYLKSKTIATSNHVSLETIRLLKSSSFDVCIIAGYSSFTEIMTIFYLKAAGKPFILSADGGFPKNENRLAYLLKKMLVSSASYWLSSGRNCTDYLIFYGADPNKIVEYPFSAGYFYDGGKSITDDIKKEAKNKLNLHGKIILTVGQFIHRKGIDILLDAYSRSILKDMATLIIIGGGPEKGKYLEYVERNELRNVRLLDFMEKSELSKYYMAADLFVLPTRYDVWGLVINEAMSFGLPVISSDMAGAAYSLIRNSENGYVYKSTDANRLKELLELTLHDETLLKKFGEKSYEIISDYTIENMARAHIDFINALPEI